MAANRRFYEAFESRDLDAMAAVWSAKDDTVCVHPGWVALHGRAAILSSWRALFEGPQRLQFIVTDERVVVSGETAWVSCDENLLSDGAGATVSALNVFVREGRQWLMTVHHGAPVMVDRRS